MIGGCRLKSNQSRSGGHGREGAYLGVDTVPDPQPAGNLSEAEALNDLESDRGRWNRIRTANQAYFVVGVTVILALIFALFLDGFATIENILDIGRNSAVLGILSMGMGVVVIGRGIDLSIIATWGLTAAITATFISAGHSIMSGLLVGLAVAIVFGLFNGVLISYVEVPALFTTLSTSLLFIGVTRLLYLKNRMGPLEGSQFVIDLSRGRFLGVPIPVLIVIVLAVLIHLLMAHTAVGRTIYAIGDKPAAAVLTGLPVRQVIVLTYLILAILGFVAGMISIGVAGLYDITIITAGTKLYDVFAIVVVGGVSLAGGRGSIAGVIAGTVFIGVVANGLVLMRLDNVEQNALKAIIILIALAIDSILHPPDEETARPGEL